MFVELYHNLDILIGEIIDGDKVIVGLCQMMGFASEVVSGLSGSGSGVRLSSQAVRLATSGGDVDGIGRSFRTRHRFESRDF